ncbi:hypothetical protein Bca101_076210 [Brassica carinata]
MGSHFSTNWNDIVIFVSQKKLDRVKLFLTRYVLHTTVYALWRERNAKKHGDVSTPSAVLFRTIDRLVKNMVMLLNSPNERRFTTGFQVWIGAESRSSGRCEQSYRVGSFIDQNLLKKGCASIAPSEFKFKKLIDECDLRISEEEKELVEPVASPQPQVKADLTLLPLAPAKPKFRHDYYQKPEEVVVTIFTKAIPMQNVDIDFGEQILSVVIDVPGEDEAYHLQPRLFGKIEPGKCRYEVLSTKVESRLAKAEIITWASLEHGKVPAVLPKPKVLSEVSMRPVYPSSKKVKDWDKLEAEVKKQEKDEELEGDAALNKSLREIYSNADEDMIRSMSKSFVESNGPVLSTDWKEVGPKTIEITPPHGMELKKWEI